MFGCRLIVITWVQCFFLSHSQCCVVMLISFSCWTDEFICSLCQKAFKTEQYLKMHMLIHTDDRPFQCNTCKKAFNRKDKLKRHMVIHEPVKQFKCPLRSHTGNGYFHVLYCVVCASLSWHLTYVYHISIIWGRTWIPVMSTSTFISSRRLESCLQFLVVVALVFF